MSHVATWLNRMYERNENGLRTNFLMLVKTKYILRYISVSFWFYFVSSMLVVGLPNKGLNRSSSEELPEATEGHFKCWW